MTLIKAFYYVPMVIIGLVWLASVFATLWDGDEGPTWSDFICSVVAAVVPVINIYVAMVMVYTACEEIRALQRPLWRRLSSRD